MDIYNVTKDFYLKKMMFNSSKILKKKYHCIQKKNKKHIESQYIQQP